MKAVDWGGERATELRHPPQTSARLASLLNYFAFSPTAEPSPRLIQPSSHFFLAFLVGVATVLYNGNHRY